MSKVSIGEKTIIVNMYAQGHTMRYIKNKLETNRSLATIKKIVDEAKVNGLSEHIEQKEQKRTLEILDMISDPVTADLVNTIRGAMSDPSRIAKASFRDLVNGFSTLVAQTLKYEDLKLKRESLAMAKEIKETYVPENDNFKNAAAKGIERLQQVDFKDFIEPDSMIKVIKDVS
jgi:hypothetical protein